MLTKTNRLVVIAFLMSLMLMGLSPTTVSNGQQDQGNTEFSFSEELVQIPTNYNRINMPTSLQGLTATYSYPDGCCGVSYQFHNFSDPLQPELVSEVTIDMVEDENQTALYFGQIYEVNSTHFVIMGANTYGSEYIFYLNYFKDVRSPQYIMSVNLTNYLPNEQLFFADDAVFAIQDSSYQPQWISRLDLADPHNPVLVIDKMSIDAHSDITFVGQKDGYIFLTYYKNGYRLYSYHAENMTIAQSIEVGTSYVSGVEIEDDIMLLKSNSKLMKLDIGDPSQISTIVSKDISTYSDIIGAVGNYTFIFNEYEKNTYIFDSNLDLLGNFTSTFVGFAAFADMSDEVIIIGYLGRDASNRSVLNVLKAEEVPVEATTTGGSSSSTGGTGQDPSSSTQDSDTSSTRNSSQGTNSTGTRSNEEDGQTTTFSELSWGTSILISLVGLRLVNLLRNRYH